MHAIVAEAVPAHVSGGPLGVSLAGKALGSPASGTLERRHDIRDLRGPTGASQALTTPRAGGGPGMVLRDDVLAAAHWTPAGKFAPDRPRPDEPPRPAIGTSRGCWKIAGGPRPG